MSDHYGLQGDFIDCNVEIEKREDEDPQQFLNRFHKEVRKSGILEEKKKRSYFTKESKKKRIARQKAQRKVKEDG